MDTRSRGLVELEASCSVSNEEFSYPGVRLFVRGVAEIVNGERVIDTRDDLLAWSTILEEEVASPKDLVTRHDADPSGFVASHVERLVKCPNHLFDVDTTVR